MTDQSTWPKDKVKELAEVSGKPLEVLCGQAFLASRTRSWRPRLGSYFQDGDRLRELDVLVERNEVLSKTGTLCRMRVLLSCRGFPSDASPLTFSIGATSPLLLKPSLLATYRRPSSLRAPREDREVSILLGSDMAPELIRVTGVKDARPLVALDVIQQQEKQRKASSGRTGDATKAEVLEPIFKLKGDGRIYEAIDSAVKAAFYWALADHQSSVDGYVTLNVPICVFSIPFWDVSIDGGRVSDPEQCMRSYQTSAYPIFNPAFGRAMDHANLTTLVISYSEISSVVDALDELFIVFRDGFELETGDHIRAHGP